LDLRVVGCHGGETPRHRTCAFVLDDVLALDAGSLTSGLSLVDQGRLEACVVSHAHLDHVRDLATIADNRCQLQVAPLVVAGTKPTLDALRKHFFNNLLWPDFSVIPSRDEPTIVFRELSLEEPTLVAGYDVTAVAVSHTIDSAGLVVRGRDGVSLAYTGDTGPTDRFWELLETLPDLRAVLAEVSFPNREQALATVSGHHTPRTLAEDLRKLAKAPSLPILLYHIKPFFQAEVERECARLAGLSLDVLELDDHLGIQHLGVR
jgi:cAMP phosphodiesterase